jgi:predicted nucleic acid-binding protein
MVKRVFPTTFIDSQFVVALINHRDQHHEEAVRISTDFVGRPLLTTDVVLVEIGNALARNFKAQAVEVIDYFHRAANIEIVPMTASLFAEAFALYRVRSDKSWGLTDCISFVVMRQAGIEEALTHDHHFTQAGFSAILRGEP